MFDEIRRRIARSQIPPHFNSGETAHHKITKAHYEALEARPVMVTIIDTTSRTYRIRQMTCVEDAIVWLVVALDLPDGQAHDLADLGRCWYDGRLFEIKEVKP
jgi:hypothetical protein